MNDLFKTSVFLPQSYAGLYVKECTDYDEEYVENEMIDVGNDDALVVENLFMHAKDWFLKL